MTSDIIYGDIAPGFEAVRDVFTQHFETGQETGAGFCVYKDGETIVDLWGGHQDRAKEKPWQSDTLISVFSCTKFVTACVTALCVERGDFSYEDKVADHWSEFAQNGKDDVTIAQLLSHQAGLSGITDPAWQAADWFDLDKLEATLAAQKPLFTPGSASGYHPVTFGPLVNAVVRRASGRTVGQILREDIAGPLGIDFHLGLNASEHERCADLRKPSAMADFGEPNVATKAAFFNKHGSPGGRGITLWRETEFAGSNGHGTAKSLARIAQMVLDGAIEGTEFLSGDTLSAFTKERYSGPNLVLPFDLKFASGIMFNPPNYFYGQNDDCFGHSGWGGSCVWADRESGLTGAYVMNKMSNHLLGDPRPRALIDALYKAL
ncbi:serine hydrolase domain-containing protein [Robiginitomaculum antarcticum]|uniref:serine hydrolase domain-containing protein n=1 Tax=Robiginitomaculum antarcticum TaxID=437507 RepID=UPI000364427E|nr:serine hydrolase domain-containing protein [Robiginitomaculum antarcticum]